MRSSLLMLDLKEDKLLDSEKEILRTKYYALLLEQYHLE